MYNDYYDYYSIFIHAKICWLKYVNNYYTTRDFLDVIIASIVTDANDANIQMFTKTVDLQRDLKKNDPQKDGD